MTKNQTHGAIAFFVPVVKCQKYSVMPLPHFHQHLHTVAPFYHYVPHFFWGGAFFGKYFFVTLVL
jgi:hypothetical protein